MVKLVLLVMVFALAVDAIAYNGAYSQTAWHELSALFSEFDNPTTG